MPLEIIPEMFEQYSLNESKEWQYIDYYPDADGYTLFNHFQTFIAHAFLLRFFQALLSVCGLFGNSVTILVLVSHGLKDTTNILLMSIAICDQLYLLNSIFSEVHRILMRIDISVANDFEYFYYRSVVRITSLSLICNICQVAIISIERVTAVLLPFDVSRMFTPYRVKCLIVFVLVYIFAIMIPTNFLVTDISHIDMADGRLKLSLLIPNIFVYILPLSIILISNVTIALKLHFSSASLLHHSSSAGREAKKQKELKLFKMLFVVCCVAFLTFSPRIAVAFILVFDPEHPIVFKIRLFSSTVFHVYTSSNFLIYVTMSSKFANTYKHILCGRY